MPDPTVAMLKTHSAGQAEAAMKLGGAYRRDLDLVFPNELGVPVRDQTLARVFRRLAREIGLPEASPYWLRHTEGQTGTTRPDSARLALGF
jgi:site-specific recombinase XerD